MYGLIHCCIEDMIVKTFDEHKWREIMSRSTLLDEGASFLIHHIYPDEETLKLITAISEVVGWDYNTCMEKLGEHFLPYCQQNDFDRLMRVLGNNLEDFLTNVDFLHNFLASLYPGMISPSFRCSRGPSGVLLLHYHSLRHGMQGIAKGLVKKIALEFFDTDVSIEESLLQTIGDGDNHIMFKIICPDETKDSKRQAQIFHLTTGSCNPQDLNLNMSTFCQAFPFHLVFSDQFRILQVGTALQKLLGYHDGDNFFHVFNINRPVLNASFDVIKSHLNATFVLMTLPGILQNNSEGSLLKLKGQMIFMAESSSMLFLGSPRETDVQEMSYQKIYLSDFRIHDITRELVLKKYEQRSERELTKKLEETHNELKITKERLKIDQQRTNDLLHSILPSKVAMLLSRNLPVPAEAHDVVTVLFSDIVGFTALCSTETIKPLDVIQILNTMYTVFDHLSSYHMLYKVETIGDAYMAVSGLPDFIETHADQAVAMGMDMVSVINQVLNPLSLQPIQIRVGIHSGPVLAGVIGQQMPRYCLIGNTVTLANKMESNSLPNRVNISKDTMSHLIKDGYVFANHPIQTLIGHCSLVVSHPQDNNAMKNIPEMLTLGESSKAVGKLPYPHKSPPAMDEDAQVVNLAATCFSSSFQNLNLRSTEIAECSQPFSFGRDFFPPKKINKKMNRLNISPKTGLCQTLLASKENTQQLFDPERMPIFRQSTLKKQSEQQNEPKFCKWLCKSSSFSKKME